MFLSRAAATRLNRARAREGTKAHARHYARSHHQVRARRSVSPSITCCRSRSFPKGGGFCITINMPVPAVSDVARGGGVDGKR